ncbi:MAG TPA: hypothetical protein VE967_16415 [Gemmatimonadaceae bacterium]|nr:hypothetical protein [Gemmatimonadaceae bacterium]
MRRQFVRAALIMLLPVAASAMQGESEISKKTVEKFDPIRLLIEKQKELKLTDKQRADLEELDAPVKWNIRKLAARVDSAQHGMGTMRSGRGGGRGRGSSTDDEPARSPEEMRARLIANLKIIVEAIADLQKEYELRTTESLKALSAEQQAPALQIINRRRDELTRILNDSGYRQGADSTGRGDAPGAGRGPGRGAGRGGN